MAIGTAAAIGLGVAGVGSFLSSKSQSKAAGKAADASVQASRENAALMRDIYGQNQQTLNPYIQRGNAAGNAINALLGLGGTAPTAQPAQAQPNALTQFQGGRVNAAAMYGLGDTMSGYNPAAARDISPVASTNWGGGQAPNAYWQQQLSRPNLQPGATPTGQPTAATGQTAQQAAENAFDIFRNSTGYQFRLNEGYDALNSGYAGAGVLQSGAAMNAAQEYGQNFASNEFGNYMNYLGNQQGVGMQGAGALAGVGMQHANSMAQNNNNAASAIGNAALVKGQNNPFANALGMVGGAAFQYGMR